MIRQRLHLLDPCKCVISDVQCKEIAEDTIQKCNEDFGKVTALIIVRPGKDGVEGDQVGKVFVEFEDVEVCKKAATVRVKEAKSRGLSFRGVRAVIAVY